MKARELFELYTGDAEFTLIDADVDGAEAYLHEEDVNETARVLLDLEVVNVFTTPYNELRVVVAVYKSLKNNGIKDAISATLRAFSQANAG